MIFKDDLIEKAKTTIKSNESLIEDDAAVAMLGIARIIAMKKENEELEIFIKVFKRLTE
ncbi:MULTISPECIES: hypothetical protein [Fusobacterium]|jgi:hypothetical protein|uniref:Uncharacterized protein n=1 Tax=Fusobacterium nucleatum CTI-6 TaxID=1316587 RepID=U7TNC9_FUSNU|nr:MULTISPECIES: hypothetical protein [Fusobacterium]ERT45819.1 hypothetical protein HMPREF1767_02247 [Fusobacterium nucleatum CTI-6]EUB15702.1 hypothetical protein HMPREF1500_0950 [Fusobacterium sp. CM22]WRL77451.1 hypothetical protein VKN79_10975 [Fusobacterium polymorphum]